MVYLNGCTNLRHKLPSLVPRPHPLRWVGSGDICWSFGPYAIFPFWPIVRLDSGILWFDRLHRGKWPTNNMAAGPKMWRKSPDPTQRSGWGLGTRLQITPTLGAILSIVTSKNVIADKAHYQDWNVDLSVFQSVVHSPTQIKNLLCWLHETLL